MSKKQTLNQKQAEKNKKSENASHFSRKPVIVILDIAVSLAVVVAVGYYMYRIGSSFRKIDVLENSTLFSNSAGESSEKDETEDPSGQTVYNNVYVEADEIHTGDLILVNNDIEYHAGNETDLVNMYENKTERYHLSGTDMMLREPALDALNSMLDDFYVATGHDDVIIISGYRTTEAQKVLYDEDLEQTGEDASTRVSKPGHSEHESGYAVDFSLFADGVLADYDGTGDYSWVNENCSKYGYILRYTDSKQEVTKIQPEAWHYRYVGQPHAAYMMEHNLCLEEYLEELRQYTADHPLTVENWDGELFHVYFAAADEGAPGTYVLLPQDLSYTISGNNTDGYIVTVDTGEIQKFEDAAADTTEPASQSTAETE